MNASIAELRTWELDHIFTKEKINLNSSGKLISVAAIIVILPFPNRLYIINYGLASNSCVSLNSLSSILQLGYSLSASYYSACRIQCRSHVNKSSATIQNNTL